jgi:hypothetical protein
MVKGPNGPYFLAYNKMDKNKKSEEEEKEEAISEQPFACCFVTRGNVRKQRAVSM